MSRPARKRENPKIDLPSFDAGFNFPVRRARYDKLEITLELGWVDNADTRVINEEFRRIARRSRLLNSDGSADFPALRIAKRKAGRGRWLFDGKLQVISGGRSVPRIKAHLSINPTRYFANNPPQRRERASYSDLKTYESEQAKILRECLDHNDNLVIDDRLDEALDENWREICSRAVERAIEVIQVDIERYSTRDIFVFEHPGAWTVKSLEVYWEYRAVNAPLVVESFCNHAAHYFRRHRRRIHLKEIDQEASFASYIFEPGRKGVSIAVYAKTQSRIRVECRFTTYPKSIYNKALTDRRFPRGNLSSLFSMIEALAEMAQDEMLPLRAAHKSYKKNVLRRFGLINTLAAISYMAAQDEMIIHRVIENLLVNKLVVENQDQKYNQALRRMAERNLLKPLPKRSRQPRIYAPSGILRKIISSISR
ncbi:MAG: hypothetical protein WBK55_06370 [Alphaproteobacteria bacterium]